jgi:alpha/beta superfamily hydrolase
MRAGPAARTRGFALAALACAATQAAAQAPRVVDLPTRPGVTQRFLYQAPAGPAPRASAILFAGGHGGLLIDDAGRPAWGRGNFLVRTRERFVARGIAVAIVDAPSDRRAEPYLGGFRQTREHAADLAAVIAWLRTQSAAPVWLVGTSRGTQSAAAVALALAGRDAPDGVVLTSSIFVDPRGRPVSAMPVERLALPVLVVHHRDDGCKATPYAMAAPLTARLGAAPRKALVTIEGGVDEGDPCEAQGHHGFAGVEDRAIDAIAEFMFAR